MSMRRTLLGIAIRLVLWFKLFKRFNGINNNKDIVIITVFIIIIII